MIDESDDDIERLLAAATPRRAPTQLRAAVMAAVASELETRQAAGKPAWHSLVGRAVAASVVFSVATFLGVTTFEARRMARWDERRVVRADVAELTATIASVTDDESARAVERYLISRLEQSASPVSTGVREDVREIERWAAGEPLAERSRSDDNTQDRS